MAATPRDAMQGLAEFFHSLADDVQAFVGGTRDQRIDGVHLQDRCDQSLAGSVVQFVCTGATALSSAIERCSQTDHEIVFRSLADFELRIRHRQIAQQLVSFAQQRKLVGSDQSEVNARMICKPRIRSASCVCRKRGVADARYDKGAGDERGQQ